MDFSTNFTYLFLEGQVELEKYRYIYFTITLIFYILTICFNALVIYVIYTDKHLHEPMYIFITALLWNSLFGATTFYPKFLTDLLSEVQMVFYKSCLSQAFCINTYITAEFIILSAMAYDRYVSICKPLQYSTLVKLSTVWKPLFFCFILPACGNGIVAILTYRLRLCKYKLDRIYCNNYAIVKLSCGDISVNNIYGAFNFILLVFPPVIFIIFSYIRILAVCLRNSKDFRRKALQTCFPHLLIFTIFLINACFDVINARLESHIPHIVSMVISVEYLIIPPLFNPIIYGLKMQEILKRIKMLIFQLWKKVSFVRT